MIKKDWKMELARERWTEADYREFCGELFGMSDEEYREFSKKGTPTERPFLGVRIPKQRAMAKEILAGNWQEFLEFSPVAFEEVNVGGFVIGGLPYAEMMKRIDDFIGLIDNWGTCDTFCATVKSVKKHREEFLVKIDEYLESLDEFKTRAGLVLLLSYYVDGEYLAVIFDRIAGMAEYISEGPGEMGIRYEGKLISWDAYYVKMAVAWLISVCFAKYPEETMAFFKELRLPKWTYNKAIAKTCESYRVDKDLKAELRQLKK